MKRCIIIILILAGLSHLSVVFGQSSNIHLSWTGLKKTDTERTMTITWTSRSQGGRMLRYGVDSMRLRYVMEGGVKPQVKPEQSFTCKAELKYLRPGTTYYYQCGSDADGWTEIYSFKTAPRRGKQGKYVIGVWSDTQNNKDNLNFEQTGLIVSQLMNYPLDLTIHTGDIVENGSVAESWDAFFRTAQPLNARVPFMPVTGNHDVVNENRDPGFQKPFQVFYDLFNLPGDYLNYSFDYGNVHFVAINSGFAQGAAKVNRLLFEKDSPEYRWLETDLSKARKNKNTNWIVLYAHYPMYAYGVSLVPAWQQNITPILDKYQVDLCLTGHRHVYERHKAIRAGQAIKQEDAHVYKQPAGTVYITNGSSGGSLQGLGGKEMPSMLFTSDEKTYNYSILTIEGKEILYEVYNNKGEKTDYFKIVK